MQEIGKVIEVVDDNVKVRFERKSACAHCGMCGFKENDTFVDVAVKNVLQAKKDDLVEIEMRDSAVLIASIIAYLIPVCLALIGLIITQQLTDEMWIQLVVCLCSLALSYVLVFLLDKKFKYTRMFMAKMQRIINVEQ